MYVYVLTQNGQKQTDPGSLEDLSRDETDRAVPLSEPITIQRRSPLIRNHKTGSMEVMQTTLVVQRVRVVKQQIMICLAMCVCRDGVCVFSYLHNECVL